MKTTYGLVIFDYNGPQIKNLRVHAFGFMQVEDRDFGLDITGHAIKPWHLAQEAAHQHWQKHLTFLIRDKIPYEVQHVFAYEPASLITNLFEWGVDMSKFDPTLPRSA